MMQGSITWEAAILLVGTLWVTAVAVAYVVWRLCVVIGELDRRITVIEARLNFSKGESVHVLSP